jgi:AraC-like DNA-binding protein
VLEKLLDRMSNAKRELAAQRRTAEADRATAAVRRRRNLTRSEPTPTRQRWTGADAPVPLPTPRQAGADLVRVLEAEDRAAYTRMDDPTPAPRPRRTKKKKAVSKKTLTMEAAVLDYVRENPGKTATEIARALGFKSASVSAFLRRACEKPIQVRRKNGVGPRGGFGYFALLPPRERATAWERLGSDEFGD